jgi:hypothetical protein
VKARIHHARRYVRASLGGGAVTPSSS